MDQEARRRGGLIGPLALPSALAFGQIGHEVLVPNRIDEANGAGPSLRPELVRLPPVDDRQNGSPFSPMREWPPRFSRRDEIPSAHLTEYLQDPRSKEAVHESERVESEAFQEAFEALEDDIDAQDDRLMELEEKVGQRGVVHVMDALSLDLGGFISQTFTSINSDDNFESSFDLSQFELFLAGEVTEKLTYFTILEFKR